MRHDPLKATKTPSVKVRGRVPQLIVTGPYPDAPTVLTRLLNTEQDPETRQLLGALLGVGEHSAPNRSSAGLVTGSIMAQPPVKEQHPELDVEAQAAVAAAELPDNYFELYKLAVEMADRISARRGVANSFFLTLNTGALAVIGTATVRWYLAAAGIVLCVSWWALLKSYRDLNRAKFGVILAMEERLPARVYSNEWEQLRKEPIPFALRPAIVRSWFAQYRELGYIERIVPWVFALIYFAEILRQVIR
jgi:hypothetical protein